MFILEAIYDFIEVIATPAFLLLLLLILVLVWAEITEDGHI